MRGAVALVLSAEERMRSVLRVPAGHFDPQLLSWMIGNCRDELTAAEALITSAGLSITRSRDGKKVTRINLDSPKVSVAAKLDITELATVLLPDSPSWYNISSGVTHSYFWGLRDAVIPDMTGSLALTPNLLDVGASAQCAISASGLVIARYSTYYGHPPDTRVRRSMERRAALDPLMLRTFPPNSVLGPARHFRESGNAP
jgi:hypothetical protein